MEQSYNKAFEELKEIVNELEKGEVSVDGLFDKVKRAYELISVCKNKLKTTEMNINDILNELEDKEGDLD